MPVRNLRFACPTREAPQGAGYRKEAAAMSIYIIILIVLALAGGG